MSKLILFKNKLKNITLLAMLPILRLEDKKNCKTRYFGEIMNNYDLKNKNDSEYNFFCYWHNNINSYSEKYENVSYSNTLENNCDTSISSILSGDFTNYNYIWFGILNTEGQLDPTMLSLVYLNIMAILVFTLLFIEYPLVPILFIMELIMFIPVLLLYLFASESTFVFLIYIINAVTVEAVSAVGIAMMYLTGWKFKDTINPDALESNINKYCSIFYFDFKNFIVHKWYKNYSWYRFFFVYVLKIFLKNSYYFFRKYLLIITVLIFIIFIKMISTGSEKYFIFENRDLNVFLYLINIWNYYLYNKNNVGSLNLNNMYKFNYAIDFYVFKKNKLNVNYSLISELFYSKNTIYGQFLNFKDMYVNNFNKKWGLGNLYFSELNYINKNKILLDKKTLRYHNYFEMKNLYWGSKQNPHNMLLLINQIYLNLQKTPDLNNFGNWNSNNKISGIFYKNYKSFFNYNENIKLSNNRLNLLDYQFKQLELLGFLNNKKYSFGYGYIKKLKNSENILNKVGMFKNNIKKRDKILSFDLDKSMYSIKKLNNYKNNLSILNITKFINLNIKNLNYIYNYKINEKKSSFFNIIWQKNGLKKVKKNKYFEELNYLDFKNLPKLYDRWLENFYTGIKYKKFLNNFYLNKFSSNKLKYNNINLRYFQSYKFYLKNNLNYFLGFKNNYGSLKKNIIKIQYGYVSNTKNKTYLLNKVENFVKLLKNYSLNIRKFNINKYFKNIKIIKENNYSINESVFYNLQKTIFNLSDKSPKIIKSPNTKTLPWFESFGDDLEVFDTRIINLFSDFTLLSEILKIDLKRKSKYLNYIINSDNDENFNSDFNSFYEFYIKKKCFKNYKNCLVYENTKKLLTNIPLDYNFNNNDVSIKRRIYTSYLSRYYEKEIQLRRIKKINLEFPSISNRGMGLLYRDDLDMNIGQVYSEQSKEFGLLSHDFYAENYNKLLILKNNMDSWKSFNKISGLFSYKKPGKININFNNDISIVGSNFFIKNYNFNNFSTFWKNINYSIKSNSEVGSGSFNIKKLYKNFLNSDFDTYESEIHDGNKNQNNINYNLAPNENSEKVKLFNFPKKNYNDYGIINFGKNDSIFNNKAVVSKRFLLTFKKKLKIREKFIGTNITRIDGGISSRNNTIKKFFLGLSNSKIKIKNIMQSHNGRFGNDILFKTLFKNTKKNKKLNIVNNSEIFENNVRSSIEKPHTLYGYLWDEYLRQTYGIGINFLNFNNRIKKIKSNVSKKKYSLSSNNFQNNLEEILIPNNNIVGLTKDREIANSIISNYLPKVGYFRELSNVITLKRQKQNNVTLYPEDIEPSTSGFLEYQKKILFSESILKKKLVKKSIVNIIKYSESPYGFKKKKTKIGVKLPYFKRKFLIKNEDFMENTICGLKSYRWNESNNNIKDNFGRLDYLTQNGDNNYFGNSTNNKWSNWKEDLYSDSMLNDSFDFEFNDNTDSLGGLLKFDYSKSSSFYYDFDDDSTFHSKFFLKTKRNSESQKIISKKIENIFKTNKFIAGFNNIESSQVLKKKKNIRLFKKLELMGNNIMSSLSVEKYNNDVGFEKNIMFTDIINNRRDLNINDYYIFKNPIIEHLRNGNLYLKNLNYNNLIKIKKRKDSIITLNKNLTNNNEFMRIFLDDYPNSLILENSIDSNLRQNLKKGIIYKVPNYLNTQYYSFINNLSSLFSPINEDVKLVSGLKNYPNKTFNIDGLDDSQFNNFQNKVLKYDIKYSKMGLASPSYNPFIKFGNYFTGWKTDNAPIYSKIYKYKKIKNVSEKVFKKNSLIVGLYNINFKYNKLFKKLNLEVSIPFFNLLKLHNILNFSYFYFINISLNLHIDTIFYKKDIKTLWNVIYFFNINYNSFFISNYSLKKLNENKVFKFILEKIKKNFYYIFKS